MSSRRSQWVSAGIKFATALMLLAPRSVLADPAKFSAASAVLRKHCMQCHTTWSSLSEQQWINTGLVLPQNVKESPITFRIKYGRRDSVLGTEDMPNPKGSASWEAFSEADYNLIRDWISTLTTSNGGDEKPREESGEQYRASDETIRLGDRLYIKSVLESIYGSGVAPIVDKYIFTRVSAFGGACDLKEHFTYVAADGRTYSNYMNCKGADFLDYKAPLVPPSSTIREGFHIKACTEINTKNDRVQAALQQIGGSATSWPTKDQVLAVYRQFLPGRTPAGLVLASLLAVVEGAKTEFPSTPLEGWRYLYLTMCNSSDWEQP